MSKRFHKPAANTPEPETAQGGAPASSILKPDEKIGHRPAVVVDPTVPFIDLNHETRVIGQAPQTVGEMIRRMGTVGCTIVDVGQALGVSEPTMHKIMKRQPEIRKLYEDGKLNMRTSLRQRLFKLAETQAGPAIFLAKNELGMRDQFDVTAQVEHTHSVSALLKEIDGKYGKVIEHDANETPPQPGGGKVIEHQ